MEDYRKPSCRHEKVLLALIRPIRNRIAEMIQADTAKYRSHPNDHQPPDVEASFSMAQIWAIYDRAIETAPTTAPQPNHTQAPTSCDRLIVPASPLAAKARIPAAAAPLIKMTA